MDAEVLRKLFEDAGITETGKVTDGEISMQDFFELGLTGAPRSSELRRLTAKRLGLPERMTSKALLEAANSFIGRERLSAAVSQAEKEMGI